VQTWIFALVLSECHPRVADGPPQGTGRSAIGLFFQKASPVRTVDFSIVVDEPLAPVEHII
jgi:hypothetical protein